MEHVLQPRVVGVALRRRAVLPARVAFEAAVPPVADVEGRIGEDEVGAQVRVLVAHEGVGRFAPEVEVDAAYGEVHGGEAPGGRVGFLAVDGDIADLAAMRFDEFLGLHEHAAGAAAGVIDLALVRGEHGDQRLDDAGRGVELAALLAFGAGELAEEVFVNLAEHVAGVVDVFAKADGGHQINQFAEFAVRQLFLNFGAGVALVENALELGVFDFNAGQRVIDALADVGLLGGGAQVFPAGAFRHPEDIDLAVVVAVLQLSDEQFGVAVMQEIVVGRISKAPGQFGAAGGEGVGNVFDENQAEHEVLVFGSIHVGAQLVGRGPEGFLDVFEHGAGFVVEASRPALWIGAGQTANVASPANIFAGAKIFTCPTLRNLAPALN